MNVNVCLERFATSRGIAIGFFSFGNADRHRVKDVDFLPMIVDDLRDDVERLKSGQAAFRWRTSENPRMCC
ncbi:hypothetical protein ACFPTO_17150 [Paraburkholderia denitrificans]|uniref:Uncharacterized protein n=1 Tax=Paraburkholderia denitrificans TaxID=694025 RepID=A0ABW0JBV2_9BURK